MTSRSYVFTLNNPEFTPTEFSSKIEQSTEISYCIFQFEEGESGVPHFQGYLELKSALRMTAVKKMLSNRLHLEKRLGTPQEASDYCTPSKGKPENQGNPDPSYREGPWVFGTISKGQGSRSDIDSLKRLLDEGKSMVEVADACFGSFLRYSRGIKEYKRLKATPRLWEMEVEFAFGKPGTGKSRYCAEVTETEGFANVYWLSPGKWFDDYEGQSIVVIDEFKGSLPYQLLLRICDRYPLLVESKGGQVNFIPKKVIITSNQLPNEWYRFPEVGDVNAILRRLTKIMYFRAQDDVQSYDTYARFIADYVQEKVDAPVQ